MAHLTPLIWTADDGYRFSSQPDDWTAYERSRMRHELTRISRLLSATAAPHAAARPEEEWVNLVLALLNKAGRRELMRPRLYPSDTSDAEWALIEFLLPVPACRTRTGGRPEKHHRRDIFDAIRYVTDNACRGGPCLRTFRLTRPCSGSSAAGPGPGSSTGSVMSFAAPSGCAPGAAPTRSRASSTPGWCAPRPPSPAAPGLMTQGKGAGEKTPPGRGHLRPAHDGHGHGRRTARPRGRPGVTGPAADAAPAAHPHLRRQRLRRDAG